jgi:uncharacterized protein
MYFSRFNVFSRIRDSENYFIVNLLSGNADILSPEEARNIMEGRFTNRAEFIEKGYLVDREVEDREYRLRYLDFLDHRDDSEIQIFFVPSYACNFNCSYCYQSEYERDRGAPSTEVIDSFYRYVDGAFADRDKYVTIFGGEPLLPDDRSKRYMSSLLAQSTQRGIDLAVVTNGYHLAEYLPLLREGTVREIQVTLDGTEAVHNARRPLRTGNGTFRRIVQGIDDALREGHTVNLRVVLDAGNISDLPALARFADEKGWIGNPRFKTQLGRNYELHTCQADRQKLFDRAVFWEKLYALIQSYPEVGAFHQPSYSFSRFLFDAGELPDPLFDSCPACKTEWAFDYTGRIYSCTATVGKVDECLGTFHPEVNLYGELISQWQNRDVTAIPACRACSLQLSCGGGCGAVAKNRTGSILAPECRPERELLELGISLYFEKGLFDVGEDQIHCHCTV